MEKTKVVFVYKAYPFCIANYFLNALRRRDDVEVYTVGEFFGQSIPWGGGMEIPMKYPNQVDLPFSPGMVKIPWNVVERNLPWKPDLVLNVDAGFHLSSKPNATPYAVVATDPHVLGDWYAGVRPLADFFFNMQPYYMQAKDHLLPYAFDPLVHYPEGPVEKEYDACLIGLHYPQRNEWVARLHNLGIKVNYRLGDIYDEYRAENGKAWIGLNWASLQDVTARVLEIMAMRMVPVLNRLPGLDALGFEDGRHYLGFSTMEEAVEKVVWAKEHPQQAKFIANNAYQFVYQKEMTYSNRIKQILSTVRNG